MSRQNAPFRFKVQARMKIALDAMGGDFGPEPLVAGAVEAVRAHRVGVSLVGRPEALEAELRKHGLKNGEMGLEIVPALDVVGMHEKPHECVKRRETSIRVACNLVRDGKAQAVVSAGHTGATLGVALLALRRSHGINRPGLGTIMPTANPGKPTLLIDVGAVVDCKPVHLVQFAVMGMVYMRDMYGCESPRIGLLSIGEEEHKGNEQTLETIELLKRAELNFLGNAEGRDVCAGTFDVVVCDGFVGNSMLKMAEGVASIIRQELKQQLTKNLWRKVLAGMLAPAFRDFKKRFDHTEYGGAPLLGLRGNTIVAHGRSNANAIKNAIRVASECVNHNIVDLIESEIMRRHARTEEVPTHGKILTPGPQPVHV